MFKKRKMMFKNMGEGIKNDKYRSIIKTDESSYS